MAKWKFQMWYYTKKDAQQAASNAKKQGYKQVRITRAKNLNLLGGGKYRYNVWYR